MLSLNAHSHKSLSGLCGLLSLLPLFVCLFSCNEEEPDLVYGSQINHWQFITEDHGLSSNFVNYIFEDSQGRIWVGTNRGLSVLADNKFTNYSAADGLVDDIVFAITEDNEGRIWVGSRRGINVLVDNRWLYYPQFYNASVYTLLALKNDGGMLIGTGGFGVYRFDYQEKKFELYSYVQNCQGCNSINALFQAKDESVWVASFRGVRKIRGTFITTFDEDDGLSGEIATTIAEDSWGNIWIGTVEGRTISKINGNAVSQVTFNNGADQNFIWGIQEDNDGNLWVGTVDNGLFHYDGAIMKPVLDGPPDKTITCMLKDKSGNLWVGTRESGVGVYVTNPH